MKLQTTFWMITASLVSLSTGLAAKADTTKARCDIYPRGEDQASEVVPCTFSQRQGNVTIVLENGTTYELAASPTEASSYTDQNGRIATRDDSLGEAGLIYRLADESIYVYWDATVGSAEQDSSSSSSSTQTSTPATYVTNVRDGEIVMQITEPGSEFRFHGYLERTSGNIFQGEDDSVRVIYDHDTGNVVVINRMTGDEYYNYTYSEADEGSL